MSVRRERRSRFSAEPTVLIVDDEETPRSVACRMVRALGYQARTARDGREALRYLQQQLAERARDLHSRLPIVLMSANPSGEVGDLVAAYPEFPFLAKPFTTERLSQVLSPLLGAPARARGRRANDRVPYRDRTRQSS
jgi:CheY-like chemotaxis protein